jgi:hypothetical protein
MQATEFTENTEMMRNLRIPPIIRRVSAIFMVAGCFFSVNSVFSVANCFF